MTSPTLSEQASAKIKPRVAPVARRVCCPNCEATFDLNKIGKPRSVEQHRRFWGLMKAAFDQWPEKHEEQFSTVNDLRQYLTMAAGWRDLAAKLPVIGAKPEVVAAIVAGAMKSVGHGARIVVHKGQLCVWVPKSIRFDKLTHLQFCALNQAVQDVLEGVFGITGDELLDQAKGNL